MAVVLFSTKPVAINQDVSHQEMASLWERRRPTALKSQQFAGDQGWWAFWLVCDLGWGSESVGLGLRDQNADPSPDLSLRGLREHVLVDSAPDQESHPTLWVLLCDFGRITRPLPHCRVRSCYRLCVGPGVSVEWKETAEEKALHKLWTEAGGCDEWMGGVQRGGVSSGTTNSPTLLPSQSLQPAFKQGTGKWMESTEKPPTS